MRKNFKLIANGLISGLCNGYFGFGGGLILIPMLKKFNLNSKQAHATSLFLVAIFCILNFCIYFFKGYFNFFESIKFIPSGLVGIVIGSYIFKKINSKTLKRIFAITILISSVRLFFK